MTRGRGGYNEHALKTFSAHLTGTLAAAAAADDEAELSAGASGRESWLDLPNQPARLRKPDAAEVELPCNSRLG